MTPKLRVWLVFSDGVRMGPGRAALLKAIDELGSIRAAAERLQMSYRHVWGHLDTLERAAGRPLILRQRGRETGGASLSPEGKALLVRYRELDRRLRGAAAREFARLFPPA